MTLVAFLLTSIQLLLAVAGYAMESKQLFYMVVYYGSPFYLFMNMLGRDSVISSGNIFYLGMLAFHVIKYFSIFRAQVYGERGFFFWLACLFETIYLVLSGYYLN